MFHPREILRVTLEALLADATGVALFDTPHFRGAPEAASFFGIRTLLHELHLPMPKPEGTLHTRLPRRLPDGYVILLSGGTTFGDRYPEHQAFRERIIERYPGHRIVQLPQVIRFTNEALLGAARDRFARHGDVHLLCLDRTSMPFARDLVGSANATLCPEMAHGLMPARGHIGNGTIGWLLRKHVDDVVRDPQAKVRFNWRETLSRRERRVLATRHWLEGHLPPGLFLQRRAALSYRRFARQLLDRDLSDLAMHSVIVTNLLHGHILCENLRIPHVLLDNRTHALRRYVETFGADPEVPMVILQDLEEARSAAKLLAAEGATVTRSSRRRRQRAA